MSDRDLMQEIGFAFIGLSGLLTIIHVFMYAYTQGKRKVKNER